MQTYRRVGVFQATETYKMVGGEWFRDNQRSTLSISDLINNWSLERQVEVVFISAPDVELIAKTDTERCYRSGVSILYIPAELIHDGEDQEAEYRQIDLPNTPEEVLNLLNAAAGVQAKPTAPSSDPDRAGADYIHPRDIT
jgi:hypothetical protein